MAMTEAWVDPHGDGPAITGVTQDIHHAGGAQIRKDIVLQHYFQRIVPEHIGREAHDRWIVAFRVPGLQGAQYFIARYRVNPDARRRHFAQNFGRRARLHCKSCLHARCACDELDVRYPLPQQGSIIQPIWGADGVRQTMQKFRRMTHEKKITTIAIGR